jgi:hypothetical protein
MRLPRGRIEPTGQARSNDGPDPGGIPRSLVSPKRGGGHTEPRPRHTLPAVTTVLLPGDRFQGLQSLVAAGRPPVRRCRPIFPVCSAVRTKDLSAPNGWPHSPGDCTSLGARKIALGDTIGVGTPLAACRVVEAAAHWVRLGRIAVHFCDTPRPGTGQHPGLPRARGLHHRCRGGPCTPGGAATSRPRMWPTRGHGHRDRGRSSPLHRDWPFHQRGTRARQPQSRRPGGRRPPVPGVLESPPFFITRDVPRRHHPNRRCRILAERQEDL